MVEKEVKHSLPFEPSVHRGAKSGLPVNTQEEYSHPICPIWHVAPLETLAA